MATDIRMVFLKRDRDQIFATDFGVGTMPVPRVGEEVAPPGRLIGFKVLKVLYLYPDHADRTHHIEITLDMP